MQAARAQIDESARAAVASGMQSSHVAAEQILEIERQANPHVQNEFARAEERVSKVASDAQQAMQAERAAAAAADERALQIERIAIEAQEAQRIAALRVAQLEAEIKLLRDGQNEKMLRATSPGGLGLVHLLLRVILLLDLVRTPMESEPQGH